MKKLSALLHSLVIGSLTASLFIVGLATATFFAVIFFILRLFGNHAPQRQRGQRGQHGQYRNQTSAQGTSHQGASHNSASHHSTSQQKQSRQHQRDSKQKNHTPTIIEGQYTVID